MFILTKQIKISMVSFYIIFLSLYQVDYILIIPTIVNIMSISEDLNVLELWALPTGLNETRKKKH